MLLSRTESQGIKGFAIMLMLVHHLFAFPDRIPDGMDYSQMTIVLAQFAKVCVPIFLFISGYGLFKTDKRTFGHFWTRIKDFYCRYWLVFIVFVPLCSVLGKIHITLPTLFLNLSALKTSYNGEWWFITLYLLILLVTPLLYRLSTKWLLGLSVTVSVLHYLLAYRLFSSTAVFYYVPALTPVIAFSLGFIAARHEEALMKIFLGVAKRFDNKVLYLAFLLLALIFIFIGSEFTALLNVFCPFFILLFKFLFNKAGYFQKVLFELGNRSLFMWLVHTFYCYKLIPNLIYGPKFAVLVFLVLLVVSYFTALILNAVFDCMAHRKLRCCKSV